jgi:Protein of unknown function (DUF3800)
MVDVLQSKYIAFFDECGDHSLTKVDPDFPLFVLSTVIFERKAYREVVVPKIADFKLRFWHHEGVNLHSRDIRMASGDFAFTRVRELRLAMLDALSEVMNSIPFTLFLTAIEKKSYGEQFGVNAANPYDVALTFTFERILHFMEGEGESVLPVTAETRGKKEDSELATTFDRIMTEGTKYNAAKRFRMLSCPLNFRRKFDNIVGMQIADLCAYPFARKILHPEKENRAHQVIEARVYRRGSVSGLKVFP